MRFETLNIPAFGPFTSVSCEFVSSQHDLHVIYGPNEAGKSSLLRGIHHLLYGFPTSTDDNFLHDYKKLRIGATVSDGGQSLTFLRKKGKIGTLLDENQNSIDEGKLKAFCGSVSPEFFSQMFGLSTDTLRSGADSLLSAQGEIGALLFSTSSGASPIESAIHSLEAEAETLFAGNGRKGNSIVAAYTAMKAHEKQARDNSLSTSQWKKLNQEITSAQKDFDHKDTQLTKCRRRLNRVQNFLKAIPLIEEQKSACAALSTILIPDLASDFPSRVNKLNSALANSMAIISEHSSILLSKQERLAEIQPFEEIVGDTPELDWLHQAITQHLNDLKTSDKLAKKLSELRSKQRVQLQNLKLKDRESLALLPDIGKTQLVNIKETVETIAVLERERDQAERDVNATERAVSKQREKLDELRDATVNDSLRELSSQLHEHNRNSRIAASWLESREQSDTALHQLAHKLGIGHLSPDEARNIKVPPVAIVEEFKNEQKVLTEEARVNQKALDELKTEEINIRGDIIAVSDEVAIVTEEDLLTSRRKRDEHWNRIEKHVSGEQPLGDGEPAEFRSEIAESDLIADTLRHHAETIGKITTLRHALKVNAEKQSLAKQIVARVDCKQEDLQQQWEKYANFLPKREFVPTELLAWLETWEKWLTASNELSSLNSKLTSHSETETSLQEALRKGLQRDDGSYAFLSKCLTEVLTEAESINGERKAIRAGIETLNTELSNEKEVLTHAEERLQTAVCGWVEAIADLQLDEGIARNLAVNELEERHLAITTDQELSVCMQEVDVVAQRMSCYLEELERQRMRHIPDSPVIDPAHPDITEKRLAELYSAAQVRKTEFDSLTRDIEQLEESLRGKEQAKQATTAEMKKLMVEAGVATPKALNEAISHLENREQLKQKLAVTNSTLTTLAGSLGVELLIQQADAEETEALLAEVQTLEGDIEEFQTARDKSRDALNEAMKTRAHLEKTTDDAAIQKQFSANALATVITDSERFIRLQHSIAFLRTQVEEYRKKSQAPMLEKTSQFFRVLTNGAFCGVGAQQDDQNPDQVNLVALRDSINDPGGTPDALTTQALSEGTRDQLYLALRMAAIDIHLEHHAAMPLILDDVLITFDEPRSRAFFELMKKLSEKTQVIVFTHHLHTAKMAEEYVSHDQILHLS
ncbi:MAG TPA: hypothetical protein DEF45_06710 [Rhodopirellula sp.]|nr:hypothetical protein [Rhodopirellula sp.]